MRRIPLVLSAALAFAVVLALAAEGSAVAQESAPTPMPPAPMPPATEAAPPPGDSRPTPVIVPADVLEDEGAPKRPADLSYGVASRLRWVTIPKWLLNGFTKQNVPLSSWGTAIEFFRRKGNFDFSISLTYTNLSPHDGNWLGSGKNASQDTDFVQFRGFAMYGADASFIWHNNFADWFGIHYGAGIGVGILAGDILRTSNDSALCTDANAGDLAQCHPRGVTCTSATCNEQQLNALGPGVDGPQTPHRFSEPSVPGAVPIVNVVLGVDFRLPQVRGWEAKIEGGFYNAFFLGTAIGYTF
jgi:hypothetical protein